MASITTRSGKGTPLTNTEVDSNFTNLNTEKIESVVDDTTPQLGGNLGTNGNDILFGDNDKAIFGAGSDLSIYHDGSNSIIEDVGDGYLDIKTNGQYILLRNADGNNLAYFETGGGSHLYWNGASGLGRKLQTTATGIDVPGTVTMDGGSTSADFTFGDNDKAIFGAGSDLQIYHDGSHSYIKDAGDGQLRLLAGTNVQIWNSDATNLAANFNGDTQTAIYYAGDQKLTTTASGIDVTGGITADGLTVDKSGSSAASFIGYSSVTDVSSVSNGEITLGNNASFQGIISYDGQLDGVLYIENSYNNAAADIVFRSKSAGTAQNKLKLDGNGDISFYEDTGTTAKLTWSAGTESLRFDSATLQAINGTDPFLSGNAYYDGSNWKYATSTDATNYYQTGRQHIWRNAASGTAGNNITWSESMRIDASGNVTFAGVSSNTTVLSMNTASGSDNKSLSLAGGGADSDGRGARFRLYGNNHATLAGDADLSTGNTSGAQMDLRSTGNITLHAGGSNAMTMTILGASGNVGIGFTLPSTRLFVSGGVNSAHATFSGQAGRGLLISTANTLSNDDGVIYNAQTAGSGKHIFQTSGTERMRISSDGLVKLHEALVQDEVRLTTTAITQVTIETFPHASYDGAKVVITAATSADTYVTELLIATNGTTAVATEYGQIGTGSALATYDVDISGADVRIRATPASATSTAFKVAMTLT